MGIMEHVIKPVVPAKYLDADTIYHINPSGRASIVSSSVSGGGHFHAHSHHNNHQVHQLHQQQLQLQIPHSTVPEFMQQPHLNLNLNHGCHHQVHHHQPVTHHMSYLATAPPPPAPHPTYPGSSH